MIFKTFIYRLMGCSNDLAFLMKKKDIINKIYWKNFSSKNYKIEKNYDNYKSVYTIKEKTIEQSHLGEVFGVSKEIIFNTFYPKLEIIELNKASIFYNSDIVVVDDKVLWDKVQAPLFNKSFPRDQNLIEFNETDVVIKKYKNIRTIEGSCISLLGQYSSVWSHFIIQYLGKLYYANEAGLLKNGLNIILPKYKDEQLKRIVEDYLSEKDVRLMYVDDERTEYICERLFYVPTLAYIPNYSKYLLPQDVIFPEVTKKAIRETIVSMYKTTKIKERKKLYLVRRGTQRTLTNWKEVEDYFSNNGFVLIEPHKLSFEKKIEVFSNACVIVGPWSSAFSNIIWCNSDVKILMFSNYPRIAETTFHELADVANAKIMHVVGKDCEDLNPHSSYYIELGKIKEAYEALIGGSNG